MSKPTIHDTNNENSNADHNPRIELAQPDLGPLERKYLLEAFDSSWISSAGAFIERFEQQFAEFVGVRHVISTNNGTTALHLTLVAAGIGPGDEVIIPAVTYISVANVVRYVGATPVLVDVEPGTLNIDPAQVAAAVTRKTRAIIAVHLYGIAADLQRLRDIATQNDLLLVEDCAEAHGAKATIHAQPHSVGSVGDMGMFSFFGNKILATGEGGAVTTNDDSLAPVLRQLRGQGMDSQRRYWFPMVGYNYRMTNLVAAIGCAQLERFEELDAQRRRVNELYQHELAELPVALTPRATDAHSAPWLRNVFLDEQVGEANPRERRDRVMSALGQHGVDSRPVFVPLYDLPPYFDADGPSKFPVTHSWANRGISLPLHTHLSAVEVDRVCAALAEAVQ